MRGAGYSDQEVIAEIHRLHRLMGYDTAKPPFSMSELLLAHFPEVDVVSEKIEEHARIEVYRRPLANGKQATIVYNENDHHSTQRFSIGHEVAHWIFDCGRGETIDESLVCSPSKKNSSERRSDFFSAEFFVPLWRLDSIVDFEIYPDPGDEEAIRERNQAIQRIAAKFNVSLRCAKRRVFDLHPWRKITR